MIKISESGQIETSFGDGGVSLVEISEKNDVPSDLLVHDNGQIVVAGHTTTPAKLLPFMVRFNSNGQLDSSFGNGGIRIVNAEYSTVFTAVETLLEDGYLCAGYGVDSIAMFRFHLNGSSDPAFGNNGIKTILIDNSVNLCFDMRPDMNNGYVFVGSSGASALQSEALVGRISADLNLDPSFNNTGWHIFSPVSEFQINQATKLTMDQIGNILICGSSYGNTSGKGFITKVLPNGMLDLSYGNNGTAVIEVPGHTYTWIQDIIYQPDGKAIIGGSANDGNDDNFCIIRLNEDGSLDPTFGNNGVVITEISAANDAIADMALQADGKLVVAGTANINGNDDIVLARYHTGLNISVNEIGEEPLFSVYPNPATETLTIRTDRKLKNLELMDALGRSLPLLPSWQGGVGGGRQANIGIGHIPKGLYLLRATDGKRIYTQRVVKP